MIETMHDELKISLYNHEESVVRDFAGLHSSDIEHGDGLVAIHGIRLPLEGIAHWIRPCLSVA